MRKKVVLVDGNSIVNRAFYGIPLLTNAEGKYTNGIYGFLNILFKLLDEEKPEYLAVAFDLHAPTFRHKKYQAYKGTRKGMPDELREQMPLLKDVLRAMNIKIYEMEGFEADDILGTLAAKALAEDVVPVIISGDRDMLQIATGEIKIRIPKTKGGKTETEDYFAKDVLERYGVTPKAFIDVKALMGDASDNIPGVPGIGEKTATKIIQEYKEIENAIAHWTEIKPKKASENLNEFQEQARLSKYLATIVTDIPLEFKQSELSISDMFCADAYEWIKRLEFKSMFSRFEQKMEAKRESVYQFVSSKAEAEAAFKGLAKAETAFVFIYEEDLCYGLALFQEKAGGIWLEVGERLSLDDLLLCARDFFEQDAFVKIGHDIKKDIHFLEKNGFKNVSIYFDTSIAAYILNPTASNYAYDSIAQAYLGELHPSEEEVLGKGKKKASLFSLEDGARMKFAVEQAEISYRVLPLMLEEIRKNGQEKLFFEIEMPLITVLTDMETYGIKVNKGAILEYQEMLGGRIDRLMGEVYALCGEEFNLNSPKQLGTILFEKLGLKGGKKTKTGYSTAADVLEKMKTSHPVVEKILEYRQLAKLKSTYADGLLAVMDEGTQKIYSTFNQTITATGRISSTEPNLQNIPIRLELGRELRKVFIPESAEYCFLDADYSQIELRVLAHISGDETLIYAFNHDQDIHRLTASQVFHVPFDEVTSVQRSSAKAVNFGIVYGIGSFSLSQDLGITRKEAEAYIAAYFAKYPKIKAYLDKTVKTATENGYVSTLWNRRRAMPELQSGNFIQRAFGERVAMNMPIQGTAADIIKIAMVKVHRALKDGGFRSRLILQVHDELLIETHMDEKEAVARILKENMEKAAEMSVPLDVDVHEGNSWFETK